MPFKSERQRRWMHANKPHLASKWEEKEKRKRKARNKAKKNGRKGGQQ